jgi:hypothetical protein
MVPVKVLPLNKTSLVAAWHRQTVPPRIDQRTMFLNTREFSIGILLVGASERVNRVIALHAKIHGTAA